MTDQPQPALPDDGRTVVPRSHRRDAGGTPSPLGRVLLPLALAVVSVAALLAAWVHLVGERGSAVAAPDPSPTTSSKPAVPTLSASPDPTTPSPSPTSASPAEPTPTPTEPAASESSVPVDRTVPVTVLNGTRRTGLASAVAAQLRAKGWTVISVGNWRGSGVTTTTVFVDGEKDAAATMRRDLPTADATRTPIGAMKDGRITVVLMDDYPRS